MSITARETYAMLGSEPVWRAAAGCHDALAKAGVPHALLGGVAVSLHGYRRNTIDIDLLVRPEDMPTVKAVLVEAGLAWDDAAREFRTDAGIPVQFVAAGERAGKGSEVRLPDPADDRVAVVIEGLPVLSLAALIESKLACGEADPRRTHRDFADVLELIAVHRLDGSFVRHLHKAVRPAFRGLVRRLG
ncbi:MAG: nucleotidyltransferase family protein [Planctomycetaceae bacterium]